MYNEITEYNWVSSAIGDAIASGLSQKEIMLCIQQGFSGPSLDAAISAQIKLNEIVNGKKK